MPAVVFLDESPLSEIVREPGERPDADACRAWMDSLEASGVIFCVSEITDYELRRELLRVKKTDSPTKKRSSLTRLDKFNDVPGRYVPITSQTMREAAQLWASARNEGMPTSDDTALDGDVILCAAVKIFTIRYSLLPSDVIVATRNVKHISRFVNADLWSNITL